MPWCRIGGQVINHRILAVKTFVHQPPEAVIPILVVKTVQIVPPHLVYHHTYYQFWAGYGIFLRKQYIVSA
jgi:hypothetical protein